MTVAATNKCNIAELTKQLVTAISWGVPPNKETYNAILENYIVYTGCDIGLIPCYTEDCINDPLIVDCSLGVEGITITEVTLNNEIKFEAKFTNTAPDTDPTNNIYTWTYDTDVFSPVGAINESVIVLAINTGKTIDQIVTPISVSITDENRCVEAKQCYYVKGSMNCTAGYQACTNPSNLKIVNKVVLCGGISALTVKKKP